MFAKDWICGKITAPDRMRGEMKRNVSLAEISDGRLYGENDMVRADCHGCRGCFQCCVGMGKSVILDPYDVYMLESGTGKKLSQLLSEGYVELNVVDGIILPNLRMAGAKERCVFLNSEGRCGIHGSRPGICRLFPLGRYYENGDYRYFLQVGECRESARSKVKVCKWIDTPDQAKYHEFVCQWHYFLNDLEELVAGSPDSETAKQINLLLLQSFFMTSYSENGEFYKQFKERMDGYGRILLDMRGNLT